MDVPPDEPEDVKDLVEGLKQLSVARAQIYSLKKQNEALKKLLGERNLVTNDLKQVREPEKIEISIIGHIQTKFKERRCVPRQPGLCPLAQAKLTISNTIFTNPDHALEGLADFSHLWVLFHFHKNDTTHIHAKVSPPRLNGLKTGVLGTRSPHRPSPIGLSLVQIDRVEGNSVYFSGVDMIDGTPVVDIKPYIPHYDAPMMLRSFTQPISLFDNGSHQILLDPLTSDREAPDGEENNAYDNIPLSPLHSRVRVPQWITEPITQQFSVEFSSRAKEFLDSLNMTDIEPTIINILKEDPRSIYVRERYNNQFYTFLIGGFHVSCKFDDSKNLVSVYRISPEEKLDDNINHEEVNCLPIEKN
ncbi:tRNA (adenine(37)-N6)-methyltransferase [Daktulosphaira vitifoliae]|uniref:tRNA (adenine(37)-N6)-methyltransferase n=1 Tax=Daktulosphaira vitifoliae TaxID=58002 RepID=UPI0021AAD2F3|nr:tRNA (adenine(37)-N6)-methyltransferase [Daktulosphaira vitifoliae]